MVGSFGIYLAGLGGGTTMLPETSLHIYNIVCISKLKFASHLRGRFFLNPFLAVCSDFMDSNCDSCLFFETDFVDFLNLGVTKNR